MYSDSMFLNNILTSLNNVSQEEKLQIEDSLQSLQILFHNQVSLNKVSDPNDYWKKVSAHIITILNSNKEINQCLKNEIEKITVVQNLIMSASNLTTSFDVKRIEALIPILNHSEPLYFSETRHFISLCACSKDHKIRQLVKTCLLGNPHQEGKNNALFYATFRNDVELIKILLEANANPNYVTPNGRALQYVFKNDSTDLLNIFLTNGVSLEEPQINGNPLWFEMIVDLFKISSLPSEILINSIPCDLLSYKDANNWNILDHLVKKNPNHYATLSLLLSLVEKGLKTQFTEQLHSLASNAFLGYASLLTLKNLVQQNAFPLIHEDYSLENFFTSENTEIADVMRSHWGLSLELEECLIKLIKSFDQIQKTTLHRERKKILHTSKELLEKLRTNNFPQILELEQHINLLEKSISEREAEIEAFICNKSFQMNVTQNFLMDVFETLIERKNHKALFSHLKNFYDKRILIEFKEKSISHALLDKVIPININLSTHDCKKFESGFTDRQTAVILEALQKIQESPSGSKEATNILLSTLADSLSLILLDVKVASKLELFKELPVSTPFLISTGIVKHALLFSIEKNSNNTYKLILFNTGVGLRHHPQWKKTNKFQTYVIIDQVPAEDALNESYWQQMQGFKNKEPDINKVYAFFSKWGEKGQPVAPSLHSEEYEQIQQRGSCSAQCVLAFIKYYIMKEAPGSLVEKQGLYKEYKAYILKGIAENLDSIDEVLVPFAQKKIEKCNADLELLRRAQTEEAFDSTLSSLAPLIPEEKITRLRAIQSPYERFAVLRKMVKSVAYQVNHTVLDDDILNTIVNNRYETWQEGIKSAIEALDLHLKNKDEDNMYISFRLLFRLKIYSQTAKNWYLSHSHEIENKDRFEETIAGYRLG